MSHIWIDMPNDMHVHLRQDAMLGLVAPLTAKHFGRALVMPNTTPPILTGADASRYKAQIVLASKDVSFTPLMTIKLVQGTTPATIREARAAGVIAAKLYPVGVTTNSHDGVTDIDALGAVFAEMAACRMVLCLHAEEPGVYVIDREERFLSKHLPWLCKNWPNLKIVVEHLTSAAGVGYVAAAGRNVAATITVHHLALTLDDVIGGDLKPHHFCKPVAKRPADRDLLIQLATRGDRVFLGTDSAPHTQQKKECASGCAGVFTAPVALAVLAEIFERENALDQLDQFTSKASELFYRLPTSPIPLRVKLVKKEWTVPEFYGTEPSVVPFMAGRKLSWQVEEVA